MSSSPVADRQIAAPDLPPSADANGTAPSAAAIEISAVSAHRDRYRAVTGIGFMI
jgi:hypothetical protein